VINDRYRDAKSFGRNGGSAVTVFKSRRDDLSIENYQFNVFLFCFSAARRTEHVSSINAAPFISGSFETANVAPLKNKKGVGSVAFYRQVIPTGFPRPLNTSGAERTN